MRSSKKLRCPLCGHDLEIASQGNTGDGKAYQIEVECKAIIPKQGECSFRKTFRGKSQGHTMFVVRNGLSSARDQIKVKNYL